MGIAIPQVIAEDRASGAQVIDGSPYFDATNSPGFLKRNFNTGGDRRHWILSCWVKILDPSGGGVTILKTGGSQAAFRGLVYFDHDGITLRAGDDGSERLAKQHSGNRYFRDSNAWYNIVVCINTTATGSEDRAKIWVNGELTTEAEFAAANYPSGQELSYGKPQPHYIVGNDTGGPAISTANDVRLCQYYYLDGIYPGYHPDITNDNVPELFGFRDPLTNTWRPKKYDGKYGYGKNGFYLPMDGNSPIGEDKSGVASINDGTIWSNDVTTSNGYSTNRDPGKGFDGNSSLVGETDTYVQSDTSASGTVTWTPNGYTIDTADEILVKGISSLDRLSVVGSLGSQSNIAPTTVNGITNVYTIPTNLGTLTSLTVTGNSSLAGWSGISVGGILLVNGLKGNSWTPVNFGGSSAIDKATGALPILNTTNGGRVATVGVRTDAFANNLVLALPLVDTTTDVSGIINSGTTSKTITAYDNAAPASDGQGNFYDVSLYLDGANDYVETSNSDDFVVGTGDFTIEAWYNVAATQGTNSRLFAQNVNDDNNWDCYLGGSFGTSDIMMHGGSVNLGMSFPSANAWHHFCIVRKNGTLYSFMNGVLKNIQTYTNSVGVNNHGFRVGVIGGSGGSTGYGLQGYVQDFRFYKGVAKYTSDFIPASTNPDILPDTPSGVSGGSELAKIANGAVYFDGTGDYLNISGVTVGTGDFTVEYWINLAATRTPSVWWASSTSSFLISDTGASEAVINSSTDNASGYSKLADAASSLTANTWGHVAVVRSSGTTTIYLNGASGGTTTNLTGSFDCAYIGRQKSFPARDLNGYISNLRIVNGTALYTSDFTPPTEPLTNVTNTTLLCCQSNTDVTEGAVKPADVSWIPTGYTYWSGMNDNWNNTGTTTSDLSASSTGDWIDTALPSSGKYYFETIVNNPSQYRVIGLATGQSGAGAGYFDFMFGYYFNGTGSPPLYLGKNADEVIKSSEAQGSGFYHGNTSELTLYDGDILMWGWDADNDRIYFGLNGTWYNNGDPAAGTGHIISGQDLSADNYYLKVGYMNAGSNALNALTLTNVPSSEASSSSSIIPSREIVNFNLVNKASNFNPFNTNIDTVRGQETSYATLNPLATQKNGTITLSDGNLRATVGATRTSAYASLPFVGKMYYEVTFVAVRAYVFGMAPSEDFNTTANTAPHRFIGESPGSYGASDDGNAWNNLVNTSIESFAVGDCMGWAYDSDSGKYSIFKNGINLGTFTADTSRTYYPAITLITSGSIYELNFGQKPFKFPPPDGYGPMNAANVRPETVIARPDQYVGVTTYHGDNNVRTEKVGFKPDLVWIKDYSSNSHFHVLCDSVRGGANILSSSNDLKQFNNTGYVQGFESDGFRLGADTHVNGTPNEYVAWAWKAGGEVGVGRSFMIDGVGFSTAGDAGFSPQAIPTSGSPNAVEIEPFKASISTETGFSIVHYKGSDNDNDGILHGLKQKPDFVIVKNMNRTQPTGNENYTEWRAWHSGFGDNRNLKLGVYGTASKEYWSDGNIYGHTSPDTSMRMVGSSTKFGVNYLNDDYIMYSWHNVPGLQKFGTFNGNGDVNGPFIELGFRPAIIWVKNVNTSGYNWIVQDSERQKYNPVSDYLVLDQINQTATGLNVDFLSNGFKLRNANGNMNRNANNDLYIYCAWAESPSVNLYGGQSNAR